MTKDKTKSEETKKQAPKSRRVKYMGRSDAMVLEQGDLEKLGIKGFERTYFPRGFAVKVPEEVAQHLTSDEGLFRSDPFERATKDDEDYDPKKNQPVLRDPELGPYIAPAEAAAAPEGVEPAAVQESTGGAVTTTGAVGAGPTGTGTSGTTGTTGTSGAGSSPAGTTGGAGASSTRSSS